MKTCTLLVLLATIATCYASGWTSTMNSVSSSTYTDDNGVTKGKCSFSDSSGTEFWISYEVIDGNRVITRTVPYDLENPEEALEACLKKGQEFVPKIPNFLPNFGPGGVNDWTKYVPGWH